MSEKIKKADTSKATFTNPDTAPFIYFDIAPTFGLMGGAVQVELLARTLLPMPDDTTRVEFATTAHLRCSPKAAALLHDALGRCLQLVKQAQEQGRVLETASADKLN